MPASSAAKQAVRTKAVGVFLLTQDNDYQKLQERDAVAAGRELNVPVEIHYAGNDLKLQTQQLYGFIHGHPFDSVAIVEPVSDEPLKRVARHAAIAGMGWVLLHRTAEYVDDLRREFARVPLCSVTADQHEIGRIQARQAAALLERQGLFLYVHGPATSTAAAQRRSGLQEILGGTTLRHEIVHGDWTEDSGEKAVLAWLRGRGAGLPVRAIICQNDAMASGALRAVARCAAVLKRPELAHLPVTGVDGNPDFGVLYVDQGRLVATVIMPPAAGPAIRLVHQIWSTPDLTPPAVVTLPVKSYPEVSALARAR